MTHGEALRQTAAYFDSQLSREEVRAFHAHINDCEDCRVRLRTMRVTARGPRLSAQAERDQEDRLQEILRRNRVMVYAAIVVLACFFFLFRLKQGV
jgi:anti-sigma factor RsiW